METGKLVSHWAKSDCIFSAELWAQAQLIFRADISMSGSAQSSTQPYALAKLRTLYEDHYIYQNQNDADVPWPHAALH